MESLCRFSSTVMLRGLQEISVQQRKGFTLMSTISRSPLLLPHFQDKNVTVASSRTFSNVIKNKSSISSTLKSMKCERHEAGSRNLNNINCCYRNHFSSCQSAVTHKSCSRCSSGYAAIGDLGIRTNHQRHLLVMKALPYIPCATMATEKAVIKAKMRGIQKDVSPFTTKRIVRRKKSREAMALDKEVFDVTAYATAEEINLESLLEDLERQGLYSQCQLPTDVVDALHVEARYRVDDEPREIFFFREGSVTFWNMPEVERNAVMKFMRRHQTDSYDQLLIHSEFENVEFTFTDNNTKLVGDEIQLQKPETGQELHHQLEKYTFSNALALSVKLAIWEASLERYVDSIEWVLQDLKEGKKVKISRDDMLRKTGELFTLRHLINLSSDLLDTPDFYWDRERLEPLYVKTFSHLNIQRRTKVMNDKLTHCSELADLLTSHLNDKHHVRLEWMIIILIMVEVAFEILHVIERYTKEEAES